MALRVLYLRTVYWFNLISGGSVGHTAGVINSLYKRVNLTVISNDRLRGIKSPITIIKPFSFKLLPKEYNELAYNFLLKTKTSPVAKNVDIIYQRYSGFSFLGYWLAKKYHKTFVLEFNSSDVWKLKNWSGEKNLVLRILKALTKRILFLPIVKRIENYNLTYASLIVVVSEVLKKQLIGWGIPESKILVNPNGVNTEQYNPTISGEKIRIKYSIKNGDTVFGFIGTFGQWHGVLEMARAIALFFKRYNPEHVKFLLIGNGNLMGETKKIITDAGLGEKVIFTGQIPQDEGPEHLAACDILLSPHISNPDGTEFFGSPTKLFEYMAMGKAIIASNLNQIGEVLENKKTALLVEPGNINQLVDAMGRLVADKNMSQLLGKNAREEVVENYTWDAHVKRILTKIENNG